MKAIHFEPNVRAEIRAIEQRAARTILDYAETGAGRAKPLAGEFEGFLRLLVDNHRVFFRETASSITILRVRDRRDAYR